MSGKNLLFITPVIPSTAGRGRNLRAFQWVNYLSRLYDVTVLYTGKNDDKALYYESEYQAHFGFKIFKWNLRQTSLQRVRDSLFLRPGRINANGRYFGEELDRLQVPRPDVILCFRLFDASLALQAGSYWNVKDLWLDLDELDSRTKSNIIKLKLSAGYYKGLSKSVLVAFHYLYKESKLISQFDKVFTSTKEERSFISKRFRLRDTDVFENMLPFEGSSVPSDIDNEAFTFLFVGNAGYFPNRDAIDVILFEIVPELKKIANQPFQVVIIGGRVGSKQLKQIKEENCIDFYPDVEDLESVYRRINAVIVPLRAGGGSSLKFLEALRHGKPVVSSPVGVRGFEVEHGDQVLIGKKFEGNCRAVQQTDGK